MTALDYCRERLSGVPDEVSAPLLEVLAALPVGTVLPDEIAVEHIDLSVVGVGPFDYDVRIAWRDRRPGFTGMAELMSVRGRTWMHRNYGQVEGLCSEGYPLYPPIFADWLIEAGCVE